MPQAINLLPDQSYLCECLSYDPKNGLLRWKERPLSHFPKPGRRIDRTWNTKFANRIAGSLNQSGYILLKLDGKSWKAHRIIYKLVTGEEPPETIDHKNKNTADNRWVNLRPAAKTENCQNAKSQVDRWSKLKGVHLKHGKIFSQICVNNKVIRLGYFSSEEEAHAAYCKAARLYHGEFWNSGFTPSPD